MDGFVWLILYMAGGAGFGIGYAVGAVAMFGAYFLTEEKEQS